MKTTKRKQNWLEAGLVAYLINIDGMPKYSDNYKRIREFVKRYVND